MSSLQKNRLRLVVVAEMSAFYGALPVMPVEYLKPESCELFVLN